MWVSLGCGLHSEEIVQICIAYGSWENKVFTGWNGFRSWDMGLWVYENAYHLPGEAVYQRLACLCRETAHHAAANPIINASVPTLLHQGHAVPGVSSIRDEKEIHYRHGMLGRVTGPLVPKGLGSLRSLRKGKSQATVRERRRIIIRRKGVCYS